MDAFSRGLQTLSSARDTAAYIAQQKEEATMGKNKAVEVKENQGVAGVLEKTRSVLDLADDQPFEGFATFQQPDDDADDPSVWSKQYQMPSQDWDDFGRPEVITITVKPGDTLNPEG